jgi:hypothetical protein
MDTVTLPGTFPERDTQSNPPVIKKQHMLESMANLLGPRVEYRIDKSVADGGSTARLALLT